MALSPTLEARPSAELVKAHARQGREPDWLVAQRLASWQNYCDTPLPKITDETWRRTDLRGISPDDFAPWGERPPAAAPAGLFEKEWFAGRSVQVDWHDPDIELDPDLSDSGLIFCSLARAARDHPGLLERFPGLAEQSPSSLEKFTTLNGAFWNGGLFIYVPPGMSVAAPLYSMIATTRSRIAVFPRLLIWVDDGASLELVEEHRSETLEDETLACPLTYAYVGDRATLNYEHVQNWGLHTAAFAQTRTLAGRNARVNLCQFSLGAALAKSYTEVSFPQPGSEGQVWGLTLLDGRRHIDHETRQIHDGDHTYSNLFYKGVLRERSRSVFYGTIEISDTAGQSNTYQQNDNLLLSKLARADSIPGMEIRTYDVRCTHGATIGRIDEEELFYLMSRGFTRPVAEGLAIRGYVEPVLAQVSDERCRDRLEQEVLFRAGVRGR